MKKILIYQDEGTSLSSVDSLLLSLQQENLDKKYVLDTVDRKFLKTDEWQLNTYLLIFPGGRDLPYCSALQGEINQSIIDFVQSGGNFLGICAGGYYGSRQVNFEIGGSLEVVGIRELQFFPGIAVGPAYGLGKFCYESSSGSQVANLDLPLANHSSQTVAAYFNGGCLFLNADNYKNVSTISTYADIEGTPSAIIECRVGMGKAILSGVHPEYSAYHTRSHLYFDNKQLNLLKGIESKRRYLFQILMEKIGLN